MSFSLSSAAQPSISPSGNQSPYFAEIISTITHGRKLSMCMKQLQNAEEPLKAAEDEVSGLEDTQRSEQQQTAEYVEDLAEG